MDKFLYWTTENEKGTSPQPVWGDLFKREKGRELRTKMIIKEVSKKRGK